MQIVCDGLDLSEAVMKVSKAISAKSTNPVLEGIKITAEDDTLTLSATDLELAIEKKIKADVKVEGEAIVPGKFFTEYVRKLTNEKIELTLNENDQLKIKYIDSEGFIQCFKAIEYPSFKKIESDEYFGIKESDLKTLINKSIFSVAFDDSRPILKGCLFEIADNEITSVALDGYRMAIVKRPVQLSNVNSSMIIPARSLNELAKILDDSDNVINIYVQKNYVMIDLVHTKIISRLLEGDFLNYKQILPTTFGTSVVINKNQFENSLERASLLSKVGQSNLVNFDIKDNVLTITSNSEIGNIKENVNISLTGNDVKISFNARYFMECLRVNADEFIKISFNSPTNPCVVTAIDEGSEYLYLILPVRIIS